MKQEAPLITKALTLVSFALIIGTVAIAASAGYSAYQEYNALSGISTTSFQEEFNGTTVTLKGLTIPNNMSYPLSLAILGSIYVANTHVADFVSPTQVIQPGKETTVSVSVNLDLFSLLQNPNVLQQVLFKPFNLGLNTTISAGVIPLVDLNISKSLVEVYPPLMGNLTPSLELQNIASSHDNKSILVPLALDWTNQSPIPLAGMINATLVGVPGLASGNYGSGVSPFTIQQGENQNVVTLAIAKNSTLAKQFESGTYPHGTYSFDLALSTFGMTIPLEENVTL